MCIRDRSGTPLREPERHAAPVRLHHHPCALPAQLNGAVGHAGADSTQTDDTQRLALDLDVYKRQDWSITIEKV